MFSKEQNLGASFKQYFEIVPALNESLKTEAYRVRHAVYCEDLGFEPARTDKLETDQYDHSAIHLLIRDVRNNTFIGCTRIIRPSMNTDHGLLPFERTCANTLDRAIINPAKLPRDKIGEVSRLAVVASFRRRKGEAVQPINLSEDDYREAPLLRFPYIPLGLYFGTVELARLNGIRVLFMLTEDRLANHFGRLGVQPELIGGPVEHHGTRFPSMIDTDGIASGIRPILRPLYRCIAEDIQAGLIHDRRKVANAGSGSMQV
ncbi:MAG: PEP-CTERM/exosortase system-associated acyltransferase [Nitrosomonas sp.]|nr:PEP-CTERM/exosortase system-associated acyltransferase [Nitrosomonas sp.]